VRLTAWPPADCDLYLMASIGPDRSGLPFTVYISERQGRSEPWVKVRIGDDLAATVSVLRPVPIQDGELDEKYWARLGQWIQMNRDVILGYWNRTIQSTSDALAALRPLPNA
jgi:hypothetical protein